ncbi:hypothetical protein FWF48_02560 [Candidatus Saccharibacteria bacterium]|nr:hypothetical protein [Candidatus Saccharibacteria bacterium]
MAKDKMTQQEMAAVLTADMLAALKEATQDLARQNAELQSLDHWIKQGGDEVDLDELKTVWMLYWIKSTRYGCRLMMRLT